ncbi:carbohydrate kinase [Winogradskyella sp. KYW1333]|uniref:carbohydrate kinase family protein n=1 Tax=Winogradskyella sp. KYW1333 TaxID=2282123 RepID=UPI000DF25682|nr:carbohydrate kinase [Winogradskyella sp. KYW1333]RCT53979.1 carbohydrate kinase [Winogradskyella sp. KYW1333]
MSKIVCFGEVLWDVFPDGKKIGGAPLNVALRLSSLNNNSTIISNVGNDDLGRELIRNLKDTNVNIEGIQTTNNYKTSEVVVTLDKSGSATYTIEQPCAWDFIEHTNKLKKITEEAEVFIYGSLASRMQTTYSTLLKLISVASFKVFDVNLRKPHYNMECIIELMKYADLIKFNEEELIEISKYYNFSSNSIKKLCAHISKQTDTKHICVTLGEKGAIYYKDDKSFRNFGYKIKVKDTVGAGDSFLASFVDGIINKLNEQDILNRSCAIGALVASKNGANPKLNQNEIENLMVS